MTDAEVQAVAPDEQRHGGRRQHATEQHVAAGSGDAGRQRGLEHLAGLARVADDEHLRALRAPLGSLRGRRAAERDRELRV